VGLDILDVKFRLERQLRVAIPRDDFVTAMTQDVRADGQWVNPEAGAGPVLFRAGTVGALYPLALEQLSRYPRHWCLCLPVFYRLRRTLMERFGVPRESVAPSARLDELVPSRGRRRHWQELSRALDLPLPGLCRPTWLDEALRRSLLVFLLATVGAGLLGRPLAEPIWIVVALLVGTGKTGLAWFLTIPWAVHFQGET
jgi:hypothetical protein